MILDDIISLVVIVFVLFLLSPVLLGLIRKILADLKIEHKKLKEELKANK